MISKIRIAAALSTIISLQPFSAQEKQPQSQQEWEIYKNFYFIYSVRNNAPLLQEIQKDSFVQAMLNDRNKRFEAAKDCPTADCIIEALKWKESDISVLNNSFRNLFASHKKFQNFIENTLYPSQKYLKPEPLNPGEYIQKALLQDLTAMNNVIDIYGAGKKPNYPEIDSISFNVKDKNYIELLKNIRFDVAADTEKNAFDKTLLSAIRLLEVNERWDAAQLEPLINTENKEAYEKVKKTDFSKYPYASLLILGAGPQVDGQKISPMGMLRCRQALRSYQKGLAPFIIVSGGRVHPFKTHFIEAVEMKRYMVDVLGIPAYAIIADPFARHTTTNVRNAGRLIIDYGFPKDKWSLVSSSKTHIDYVEKAMDKRSMKELGNVPYIVGKRINDLLLEYKPTAEAFIINPAEPLDP
ncbi:YdcF family protein [Chryseobacterium sp.]|uniref:YdcF family protein n=1 Tax=Chryseobacterium sp. TaxID=1871047 RepID=UPI0025B872EF|nr:YdcF family protein [Chryseobacterium sp.]MBV8327299.1 YdcF family protein [Chryseobacterium sp.]